jgi:hypothetical protein
VAKVRKRVADVAGLAKKVAKDETPDVAEIAKLRIALRTSALSAPDRSAVWEAVDKAEGVLHRKLREGPDAAESASEKGAPKGEPAKPDSPDLTAATNRRASVAIAFAQLAGLHLTKSELIWTEAKVAKPIADAAKSGESRPMAERLSRLVAPPAAGLFQPDKFPGLAPAELAARSASRAADGWLEQHFRAYQLLRPQAGDFYPTQAAAAARRVRQSAE